MTDSAIPVIVGVAQVEQRTKDFLSAKEPIDLMAHALHSAINDTTSQRIRKHIQSIRVSQGMWQYEDPAKYLAENLELQNVESGKTVFGGNGVQTTVNLSALDIQAGRFDVIALTGAECGYTQANARRAGQQVKWRDLPGKPTWTIKSGIGTRDPLETECQIGGAAQMYAIFENALRYERGESIEDHQVETSYLWERFNSTATRNPHAWIQDDISAEEIRTESASNRPIVFPYPKLMNANNNVDQGAAIIMCSLEKAKKLRIPEEKWVYPIAGTDAHDTPAVSHRAKLTEAPGLRKAAERVLELADVTDFAQIGNFDLYSCFPSAVQVAAKEIGLELSLPLTVTGGLTFGGGPLNNYVMHAIARTVELLRKEPNTLGMVTANGGYLTKHAHGIYSNFPEPPPFKHEAVQKDVDTSNDRTTIAHPRDAVTVEGYTVMHGREAPVRGVAACLTDEGQRTWGYTTDVDLMSEMRTQEFCGRKVKLDDDGVLQVVA